MTKKKVKRSASVDTRFGEDIGTGSDGPPIVEGDDAKLRYVCTQQDRNNPLDLSQSGEKVEWVAEDSNGNNVLSKDTAGGDVSVITAAQGILEVNLKATDTTGNDGDLSYSLRLTDDGNSNVTTLARGTLTIDTEVTR